MSLLTHARDMLPIGAYERTAPSDTAAAGSHAAMIKRFCKFALTMLLFTLVIAAIVALKSAIWIPHFGH